MRGMLCSTSRHRCSRSHTWAMRARAPPGWHSQLSPKTVRFLPRLGRVCQSQNQHCPGPASPISGCQRVPQAPIGPGSGQRDAPLSKGKLRHRPAPGCPIAAGQGEADHPPGAPPRYNGELFSIPLLCPRGGTAAEGYPDRKVPPCNEPTRRLPPLRPGRAGGQSPSQPRAAVTENKAVPFGTIPFCPPPRC